MNYTILHRPSFALAEVSLTHGETLHAEPGSMVSKTDNVRLNTGTKGGILQSLRRAAFAGETFLVNNYTSEGPGTLTLAPTSPGDIEGIELSGDHLLLQSGAYIASSEHIETNAKWTGAKTFFTGEGLFLLRCTGYGIILGLGLRRHPPSDPGPRGEIPSGHRTHGGLRRVGDLQRDHATVTEGRGPQRRGTALRPEGTRQNLHANQKPGGIHPLAETETGTDQVEPTWQLLFSQELDDDDDVPKVRISNSGHCPRELTYIASGYQETEPPDEEGEFRMAMGHAAEVLIIKSLKRRGWDTQHTVADSRQLELQVEIPGTGRTMTGHPDGICRHPVFTNNHWLPLECKSMSPIMADRVAQDGLPDTYPQYMAQVALYDRALYDMGLTTYPNHAVFAIIDREGTPRPMERVKIEPQAADAILQTLAQVFHYAEQGIIPERPYPPDSFECRNCRFHTLCRGTPPQSDPGLNPATIPLRTNDSNLIAAADRWLEMKPDLDRIKRLLQDASDDAGKADIIAGEVTAGYFTPRSRPIYDVNRLEELVPGEILRQCLTPATPPRQGFWIRQSR